LDSIEKSVSSFSFFPSRPLFETGKKNLSHRAVLAELLPDGGVGAEGPAHGLVDRGTHGAALGELAADDAFVGGESARDLFGGGAFFF